MVRLASLLSVALVAAVAVDAAPTPKGKGKGKGGQKKGGGAKKAAKSAGGGGQGANNPRAVYFMTNQQPNMIAALPVAKDGTLKDGTMTATGGDGSAEVDPMTGEPTVPDALASQGSVRVAGNMLFNVNAGSNTVSMFMIDTKNPLKLTMVGKPANTGGEFPVTMAVSMKNKMVCVGNSGAKAGVACGPFDTKYGVGKMDQLRPFDINQSTPPTGPTNSVATTFFNTDETMLFTTVKGDPDVGNTGQLAAYTISNGKVSMKNTGNSPDGTAVLFGTNAIPGTNKLVATDASFGGAIIDVDRQGKGTISVATEVEDQMATCWVTISKKTGTAFLTDVGKNHLLEMDLTTGAIESQDLNNNNPGMIDIESGGNFMYALSPGNGTAGIDAAVAVFDISGGKGTAKQIQNFQPKGVNDFAMGMQMMM